MTAHFTTDNVNKPPKSIAMALKDGPFRELLRQVDVPRARARTRARSSSRSSYEFKTSVLETLVGPVFNQIAHTFIDAFVRRAEAQLREDDR